MSFTYVIESIDSKIIFVCLINDYSLIANLHTFVYGSAECPTISLECTEVKLLILNNFGRVVIKRDCKFYNSYNAYQCSPSILFSIMVCQTHTISQTHKNYTQKTNFLSPLKFEQLCICFTILYRVRERENIGADGDYK